MNRFADQTVIVTGASRGIGAATAIAFANEGARVAINYRADEAGARTTLAAIEAAGGTAAVVQADVGVVADVERLADTVQATLGPASILVNNAAMMERTPFLDLSLDDFEAVWRANVRGVFQLSQRVAADMVDRGEGGVIVNVASGTAMRGNQGFAYPTAKGGVILGIVDRHQIPIEFIGVGERVEDLKPFDAEAFVQALFESPEALEPAEEAQNAG